MILPDFQGKIASVKGKVGIVVRVALLQNFLPLFAELRRLRIVAGSFLPVRIQSSGNRLIVIKLRKRRKDIEKSLLSQL